MDVYIEELMPKGKDRSDWQFLIGITVSGILVTGLIIWLMAFMVFVVRNTFTQIILTFGPLAIAAVWYGVYRLCNSRSVEYEYIVINNNLDIDKIMAKKRRTKLVELDIKDASIMACVDDEENNDVYKNIDKSVKVLDLGAKNPNLYTYFIENAPAAQNDRAEIRRLEPYCYGQFTEGKASPNFGRSHVHWLTGTASTVMVGCVEGILGMRPDFYGLHIAPSIPKAWDGFEIEKDFRGCHLHIVVKNPDHVESGCRSLLVNGQAVEGDYIPEGLLSEQTEIELTM